MSAATGSPSVNTAAVAAMRAGRTAEARWLLEEAVARDPNDIMLWLNLAGARRALGENGAAFAAVEAALRIDARSFHALLMKASLIERTGDLVQAAIGYGLALTQAPPRDRLDAATQRAHDHAIEVYGDYTKRLRVHLADAVSGEKAAAKSEESRRIGAFIDHFAGSRRIFQQRPSTFYYPGLPSIEFYPRDLFPWLDQLEAATPAIQAELAEIFSSAESPSGFSPYVAYADGLPLDQWAELNHSPRWTAFHLLKDGVPVAENWVRVPATGAAIRRAPTPDVQGRSPAAMFSVLQPKTRIPPHNGVSNTRLVVHLPLVIPPGCGFRVGNETRKWRIGEAWVFDDTIEHEAWNESGDARTILIFDIWSPFLSPNERELIQRVTRAADAFNGNLPGGDL